MDSFNEVLVDCVKALGGSKVVGPMLYPEKLVEAAQRTLLDALNPERDKKLSPEQANLILRKARHAGYHAGAEWLMQDLGYAPPIPVTPKDEAAELQRRFIEATEDMAAMMSRMQALQAEMASPTNLRAA